jgi:predicted ester cyclase
MSTEQNKQAVLRWKDEAYNNKNVDIIDELFAPNYLGHIAGIPGPVHGPAALKHLFTAYFSAFDIRDTPEFLIAEGDMIVVHDTYRFKHTGAFQGIPPTGQEVTMTGTDIYRIVGGKFVEQWVEADYTSLLLQLGVIPTARQGTP